MKQRVDFHLLNSKPNIAYHPGSNNFLCLNSVDAGLIQDTEKAWDPFSRNEMPIIDEFAYGELRSRLLEKLGETEASMAIIQSAYFTPHSLSKLVLLVSHGCNMGCSYCFHEKLNQEQDYMTPEVACRAIQSFLDHYSGHISTIFFFGGEPLLNWKTIQAAVEFTIRHCKEHQIDTPRFAIQTNGTVMDAKKASYLKEHNFLVTISLDGPPVVNDKQRLLLNGRGTYDKVERSISLLIEHGIQFNVEATVTKLHVELGISIREVFDHLIEMGAYCVHIMPVTGSSPTIQLSEDVVEDVVSQFRAVAEHSVSSFTTENPKRLQYALYIIDNLITGVKKHICYAGTGTTTVKADGNIFPCYFLTSDKLLMGNIYNEQLSGRQYQEIQSLMATHTKEDIWPCKACWARNLCNACYGAQSSTEKRLLAPVAEVCLMQRGMIDAALGKLIEISHFPDKWNKLMHNFANEFLV